MGKMRRRKAAAGYFLLFMCMILQPRDAFADVAGDIKVEQILTNMPEVKIYLTGKDAGNVGTDDVEVRIDEALLKNDRIETFSETEEGIQYIFLLDISGSMAESDFQAAKEAVSDYTNQIEERDSFKLLTFGDTVECLWDGDENAAERTQLLESVDNDNDNTQLFGALEQAANLKNTDNGQMRSVAVVLSDGKDDILGKTSNGEALEELQARGLPVYGIIVGETDKDSAVSFGEFVRSSGGQLLLAKADTLKDVFSELEKILEQTRILYLYGETNIIKKDIRDVNILFLKQKKNLSVKAGFYEWQKDTVSPYIQKITQTGSNQIEVVFSENVIGADQPENFEFEDSEGKIWTPDSCLVKQKDTIVMTFSKEMYTGRYTLNCRNITDNSMEENPVDGEIEIEIKGIEKSPIVDFFKTWGWITAIVAVILAGIMIFVIYHKIKKNKGLVLIDEKLTLASRTGVDVRQHIALKKTEGIRLYLTVKTAGTEKVVLERDFQDSVIVGRSQLCDLCIEDVRMSKQHFVLEYEKGKVFIMDLESKNGTAVNGIRIQKRQKLVQGDAVTAGSTRFVVCWE